MANIVYRSATTPGVNGSTQNKGSPLLNTEIDGNFKGLQDELDTKAPLASPALTGTPTAPTAAADTNTTQIATTAHVFAERSNTATLTNKTLTNPTINAGSGTVVLPGAVTPAQTAEGSVVWDTDNDLLTVGTGSGRKTLVDTDSTQSLSNKTVNNVTITAPSSSATLTIANGKTFTLNNTLTFGGTDASSVAFGSGGTVAYQGGTLAQFAATTSAQLAGVISDETGTGALVFANSPVLDTPVINTSLRVPTVFGSNANSANLTLSSTSATTKGAVLLGASGDTVKLNTTTNGVVTTSGGDGTFSVDTTVYYKSGGTDVAIGDGGTGLSTAPTNGQILIGNAGAYSLGTLTAGTGIGVANAAGSVTISNSGVTSLSGTANRVSVSASTGAVTLSGPQDIHTGATPSFVQVNLSSAPTASGHAATKEYVDNLAQGLDVKQSVKAATTANITLSGPQTIDTVSVIAGDRVLVKNQTTTSQNGIYVAAAGAWGRAADMDAWAEVPGSFVFVEEGTVNADTGWVATANQGGTIGTTAITWAQFSGAGTYIAGGGIGLTGTTFSVAAGTGLQQDADGLSHADTSNQASVDNSGNTFIQDITLDGFGHITGIASGTVSIGDGSFTVNTGSGLTGGAQLGTANQTANTSITIAHADTSSVADLSAATNTFIAAETYDTFGHVLTRTTGTVDFTVASNHAFQNVAIGTDTGYTWGAANTNTTQAADSNTDTLTLVNGGGINLYTNTVAGTDAVRIEHADTSSQASVDNSGNTFIQDITLDTYGHITAIASATVSIGDGSFTVNTGSGLTGGAQLGTANQSTNTSITLAHADTSSVADLTAATNTFIAGETYDTFGHVLTRTTGTVDFTVSANHAFQTVAIATDSGYTWGADNANTNQTADSSTDTLTLVTGSGIVLNTNTVAGTDAIRVSHADTSTQASVDNSGNTFIQDITLDGFGHITAIASGTVTQSNDFGTVTVTDTDSGYTWAATGATSADTTADTLTVVSGGAINVDVDAASDAIRVSHADTSSVADLSSDNSGNTFIQDISFTFDTYGHVTAASVVTGTATQSNDFGTVTVSDTDSGYTWTETGSAVADATGDTLTIVSGGAINVDVAAGSDAIRISHSDTSTAANLSATSRTYVTALTFDTYGHVTGYSTGSESVSDTNTTYTLDGSGTANNVNIELIAGGSGSGTDQINVQGAGATTVEWDETNQRITITSTDTQPANGTLTMNVSGNGLSGSQTFTANQSSAATFTVTSNATSANTASTIVFRDASGNFTAGTITATDFNSTSDARLKKNVQGLNGMDMLSMVNPVQFNWKDSEKKSYGVIAQELEQILPELVGEREDGMKSVHYIPLIAMLVDAVKTLDARVKELENK